MQNTCIIYFQNSQKKIQSFWAMFNLFPASLFNTFMDKFRVLLVCNERLLLTKQKEFGEVKIESTLQTIQYGWNNKA